MSETKNFVSAYEPNEYSKSVAQEVKTLREVRLEKILEDMMDEEHPQDDLWQRIKAEGIGGYNG